MATATQPRHGLSDYVQRFKACSADDKLAILARLYHHIGEERIENPDENKESDSSLALYNKLKEKHQTEQLQFMRDVVSNESNALTIEYNQLSDVTKIATWYRLGQGMTDRSVVDVPNDYQLSEDAEEIARNIGSISFEQCYIFVRDVLLSD
ncbi:MAG: orange carotenoid protein N-terminal domain-containing protein [Cyanobacteria bacterium J06627_28]